MALRTIEVDDDVFAVLQREAVPFVETTPNQVLRRVLLKDKTARPAGKPGDLMPLLDAGIVRPGDQLVHEQPRKRRTHRAVITSDGYIQLDDGRRFAAPSPALKACVGSDVNGWAHWTVERLGKTLSDLRGKP